MSGFEVQQRQCSTCIFRKDSPLDLDKLMAEITDDRGHLTGHRICHHSDTACCRGFWDRHAGDFAVGQVAQRLGMVEFVEHDTLSLIHI